MLHNALTAIKSTNWHVVTKIMLKQKQNFKNALVLKHANLTTTSFFYLANKIQSLQFCIPMVKCVDSMLLTILWCAELVHVSYHVDLCCVQLHVFEVGVQKSFETLTRVLMSEFLHVLLSSH